MFCFFEDEHFPAGRGEHSPSTVAKLAQNIAAFAIVAYGTEVFQEDEAVVTYSWKRTKKVGKFARSVGNDGFAMCISGRC